MNRKKMYKKAFSLLVTALFIFSVVNVIAGSVNIEKSEASEITREPFIAPYADMIMLPSENDPVSQEDPFCGVYIQGLGGLPSGSLIAPGTYNLDVGLWYDPSCYPLYGPPVVKAFVEIYEDCCGEEVLMYETSFEDNFDIYNNWIQVDMDCGEDKEGNPGFYDTWTLTNARANCDSEHSMKNTMYSIYKGNQDDFLECTKSFDISDKKGVKVEFDIWVEGDWDEFWSIGFTDPDGVVRSKRMYTPFDYLDFEVGDWAGNWVNPDNFFNGLAHQDPFDWMIFAGAAEDSLYEGAYKFPDTSLNIYEPSPFQDYTPKAVEKGGGWWTITWECPTWVLSWFGLNIDDIQFRFSWHSDPEFQFEGAYVDCFKVFSIEECSDKIFQSHTQGPVVLDPANPDIYYDADHGNYYIRLPMQWDAQFVEKCGQKESTYNILVWIEVLNDPCTYWTPHDWPFPVEIEVHVGEWYSCEVSNLVIETSFGGVPIIPGDGIMDQGDDAHIMADVHVCGAVPTENLVVEAYAEKVYWEDLYYTDCSNSMDWEFGAFGGDSLFHITDTDSFDAGGESLGCFDRDTNHYHNDLSVVYALNARSFDIADKKALVLDYYTKYITEGSGDYWAIMLYDAATNYVLGNVGGVGFPTYGYQPEWIGPMQPYGKYQSFDMLDAYDYWHDVRGMFRNPDGTDATDVGFGFAMWGTDGSGYVNLQAEANGIYWSGLYFDEVAMRGELVGEEVWRQSVIIPGPMEPCDTTEVQFEWEDVPYSNYKISIECEQGCQNCGISKIYEQILVVSNKERAHWKEIESIDYTGVGEGEWGISSSDYDNYLASNPDSTLYEPFMNAIAQLAPGHGGDCGLEPGEPACLDISHLLPLAPGDLLMDFAAWWDIEGGYPTFGVEWDYATMEIAVGCPADTILDWQQVLYFGDLLWSMGYFPESSYYYTGLPSEEASDGWVTMVGLEDGSLGFPNEISWWIGLPVFNDMIVLGMILTAIDPAVTEFSLRFRFVSDSGFNFRGIKLDDILITNLIYNDDVFPPVIEDFFDPCDDMSNWCADVDHYGQWWEYDDVNVRWCTDYPPGIPVQDALIWTTEIKDCYEAYFTLEVAHDFGVGNDRALLEIREVGATQWYILDEFTGASGAGVFPDDFWITNHYNLNFWVGKDIQIRIFVDSVGDGGEMCVRNMIITGKQDHTAPTASITMSGTMKDSGWYASAVKVKITAQDTGSGVKEIHYILDGVEKVVAGDVAEFTISGNGIHTLEYWAVD
ncbi:MAG: hypothetical protein JSV67_01940, partial [Thermoplasmatales archaeon]